MRIVRSSLMALSLCAALRLPSPAVDIVVDWDRPFQRMEGFGAMLYNYSGDPHGYYANDRFLRDYVDELGNSMVRFEVHPSFCPKELPLDQMEDYANYGFDLASSNIGGIDSALGRLKAKEPSLKVIGTVWSPPGWMKDNGTAAWGGHLKPAYYGHYARFLYQYVKYLRDKHQVDVYALSIQNELRFTESYNSCLYDPQTYHDALKAVVGYFRARGSKVKFFGPEDMTGFPDNVEAFVKAVGDDPATRDYLDAVATHGYSDGITSDGGTVAQNMDLYNRLKGYGTEFWMTETSGEDYRWKDTSAYDESGGPLKGALVGLGTKMHVALAYGQVSGWTYWAYGSSPGTYGIAPDAKDKKYRVHEHYSKFIRPGAYRVEATPDGQDGVSITTYYDVANHRLTAVLLNTAFAARPVNLQVKYGLVVKSFQAYRTSATEDFAKLADLAVTDANRTAAFSLPARSLVTLVGDASPGGQGTPAPAPTITLSAPSFSASTLIPATLTINRNFGYWSLDGAHFTKFDRLYDGGAVTIPIRQSGTLTYYASDSSTSSPKLTQAFTITRSIGDTYAQGADGVVKVEAENYTSLSPGTGAGAAFSWSETDGPLYARVMQASPPRPNDSAIDDIGAVGPALHYRITFSKTGTHYLWMRGTGPASYNGWDHATIYYGLDGVRIDAKKFNLELGGIWANHVAYDYMQWQKAAIQVNTAGTHSVDFWMHADGFKFDKFEIAADPAYTPDSYAPPPASPKNLKVVGAGVNDIKLSWDPVPRAVGYRLWFRQPGSKDSAWGWGNHVEINDSTVTSYDFSRWNGNGNPLHANTPFQFHVSAKGKQDDSHNWDPPAGVTVVSATTLTGAGGGYLGFEPAGFGGYPFPSSGSFSKDGYRWDFHGISADVSLLGSTEGTYRKAAISFGDSSWIASEPLPGGVGNLSFRITRPWYPTGSQFAVLVNGKEVGRTHKLDYSTYNTFDYTFPGVNATGNVAIKIIDLTKQNGNDSRGVIGDLAWTPYAGGAPPAPAVTAKASEPGVALTWGSVTGATGYRVFRTGFYPENLVPLGTVAGTQTSFFDSLPLPGNNTYRVTAINANGESPLGAGATVKPVQGLHATYYSGNDLTGAKAERVDSLVKFTWNAEPPMAGIAADRFSASWEGSILLPMRANADHWIDPVTFQVQAKGAFRLWVNGKLLLDRWASDSASLPARDTLSLAYQARYPIRLEYRKTGAQAQVELGWSVPDYKFDGAHGLYFFPATRAVQVVAGARPPITGPRPIAALSLSARDGKLWLEAPEGQAFRLEVFDMRGRLLAAKSGGRGGSYAVPVIGARGMVVARARTRSEGLVGKFILTP